MNVGSLFSGIGGLDHGLARAGFRHAFLCESDSWRRGVLAERFPGVPIYEDVREVARADLPDVWGHGGEVRVPDPVRLPEQSAVSAVDDDVRAVGVEPTAGAPINGRGSEPDEAGRVHAAAVPSGEHAEVAEGPRVELRPGGDVHLIAGGTPCQDLSVAGQRRGLEGERSGLFYEYARVVDALRPDWLLWENVPGAFSSQGGRDFGSVLGTLADLGYGLGWRVLDSRYFGVPQRRRRVFIVGARADGDPRAAAERAGQVLAVGSRCPGHSQAGGEARQDVAGTLGGGAGERGWAQDTERMTFVASPLSHGSNPNSNMAGRRREDDYNLVAETVRSHPRPGSNSNGNLVAYPLARRGREGGSELEVGEEGVYNALRAGDGGSSRLNQVLTGTVRSHPRPGSNTSQEVLDGAAVRRLTPVECERLQGLPDDWSKVPTTAPDSRRYAGLGDAVTANVAEWIGRRILRVEANYERNAA